MRWIGVVLVGSLLGFLLFSALAAAAYPGGTYCEPEASSYRFWGNFFCDLTAPITRRGEDNARAAAYARAAFFVFGLGLIPFFWLLGGMGERARVVRLLGGVAGVATLVLAWVPSRAGLFLHAGAVFAAIIPGLLAASLGALAVSKRALHEPSMRPTAALGLLALATSALDAALYVYALTTSADCLVWLPALQKVAAMLVVAWMFSVALCAIWAKSRRVPEA